MVLRNRLKKQGRGALGQMITWLRTSRYTRPLLVSLAAVVLGLVLRSIWPSLTAPVILAILVVMGWQISRIYKRSTDTLPPANAEPEPNVRPDWQEVLDPFKSGDILYQESLHWLELWKGYPHDRALYPLAVLALTIISLFVYPLAALVGVVAFIVTTYRALKAGADWWYGKLTLTFNDYDMLLMRRAIYGGQAKYGVKVAGIGYVNFTQSDWERWLGLNSMTILVDSPNQHEDPRILRRTHVKDGVRLQVLLNALVDRRDALKLGH